MRAYWNGTCFCSRNGNRFFAPEWFVDDLPDTPLDGELWIGRKQFQRTISIVRRLDASELWREVRFLIFDAPALAEPFEQRVQTVSKFLDVHQPQFAQGVTQTVCRSRKHLDAELKRIESLGGEGLMLRQPGSQYVPKRSGTLLKVKSFLDCEATVVGHEQGKGRHKGRLGALLVELADGTRCSVGTGLSDRQRETPPALGTIIQLKYQELTDGGVPRFPVFAGMRTDASLNLITTQPMKGDTFMTKTQSDFDKKRRFEFVEGASNKFWEIVVLGTEVCVCFGRIGTTGQTNNKVFPTTAAAETHAQKLIRAKIAKGYIEAI